MKLSILILFLACLLAQADQLTVPGDLKIKTGDSFGDGVQLLRHGSKFPVIQAPMLSGNLIVVSTDSAVSGQIFWTTVFEQ